MKPELKVPYESPEAASIKTVTGWVARTGQFLGADEHLARYIGCTHLPCKTCGVEIEVRGYCKPCARERAQAKYDSMPESDWNGSDMLCLHDSDIWFRDTEEILNWCEEQETSPSELRLVIGEPTFANPIDANEHYSDDLPEDGEVPAAIAAAFHALNIAIGQCQEPLCWYPGAFKVSAASKAKMCAAEGDTP